MLVSKTVSQSVGWLLSKPVSQLAGQSIIIIIIIIIIILIIIIIIIIISQSVSWSVTQTDS